MVISSLLRTSPVNGVSAEAATLNELPWLVPHPAPASFCGLPRTPLASGPQEAPAPTPHHPTPHTRAPQPDAGLLAALCALWLYPPARPLGTTRPAHPPPWGPVLSILRCPRRPLCRHRAGRRPARRRQGLCPPGVPAWWTEGPQDFAGRSPSPGRLAAMLGLWVTPKPEGRRVERLLHRSRKPSQRWVGTSPGFVVRRSGFESGSHHNDCVNLGTRRDCSDPRSLSCGRGMPPRRSLDQRRKGY